MILQLMKTTPYLSGQHRLDVCLNKIKDDKANKNNWTVMTGNCHLSPLSENIAYTDSIERSFFSQTYGDNLKNLYAKLKDDFFRDVPEIKSENILYEECKKIGNNYLTSKWIDTTDHSYTCGLKRMRFQKYGTQFSWLCPIWIENENDIDRLSFIMTVYGDKAKHDSMKFRIKISDDLKKSLKEWLSGVSSDLLYIDIDNEKAVITGVNAEFGTPVTENVSYIITQLIDRERPVLETNSTLNQLFASNKIIARQLINFNFCFSLEDLIPNHVIKEMEYKRWKITLDAYLDDTQMIEKVDFLSNYEFLPSYISVNGEGHIRSSKNVLDYLQDSKFIDYMYIDKTTQPDPYWSLVENPKYIYNFYNGFSSWYNNGFDENGNTLLTQTMGLSMNQPDVEHLKYYDQYNNIGWCETYDLSLLNINYSTSGNWNNLKTHLIHVYNQQKRYTHVSYGPNKVVWINGIRFNLSLKKENIPEGNFNIIMCFTSDSPSTTDFNRPHVISIYGGINVPKTLCILVPSKGEEKIKNIVKDQLTVKSLTANLPNFAYDSSVTENEQNMLENFIKYVFPNISWPTKIFYRKSITPIKAESPDINTDEISYIKQEYNVNTYLYRYSGAIRPYFIACDDPNYYNIDHYYKKWSLKDLNNIEKTNDLYNYNKYLNSGFSPLYPSIGYYSIEGDKNNRIDYFKYPIRYYDLQYEFQWYEDSRFYFLPKSIELTISPIPRTKEIKDEDIRNWLSTKLSNNGIPETVCNRQIKDLYDYKIDYDYVSETDINNYIFKVKYILR